MLRGREGGTCWEGKVGQGGGRAEDVLGGCSGAGQSPRLKGKNPSPPANALAVQVRCLLDQATDPNILGRTFHGWKPYL